MSKKRLGFEEIRETAAFLAQWFDIKKGNIPQVGVVLGSGLGRFAESLIEAGVIPYGEIPHFPRSGVEGHAGMLRHGKIGGAHAMVMEGRVHRYEGWPLDAVIFPVRVLAALGCRVFILTNAAGAIDLSLQPGQLAVMIDHLNLMGKSPLEGANDDRLGTRFPDMSRVYDPELIRHCLKCAEELGIRVGQAVYAAMRGPQYETPAEIRMLKALGAGTVGMSTVPEAIALRHMGISRILGISCVTNLAAGLSPRPLSHEEVKETAARAENDFRRLLTRIIETLAIEATPEADPARTITAVTARGDSSGLHQSAHPCSMCGYNMEPCGNSYCCPNCGEAGTAGSDS